ncbi:PROTEIN DMP8-RELATED [Salix purpurea]|uniref:PROTEIN DMP8-RELATED n=1 Tax=Salix purpurea TaxID=77065 RepID=A0A9Q0TUQ5_SALPP|nr:PROTEIN DMP8-RELATED [Salix purpurea]
MEQTPGEEIGIRIYTASPQNELKSNKITTGSHQSDETKPSSKPLCNLTKAPKEPGSKRRAVAKGMQKTISKTSMLVNFLPTGTLLTFEMLLPSISKNGACTPIAALMIHALLGLCSLSCFFFHFTDSFKGPDDKIYYGFVTTKGLAVFKPGLTVDVPKDERYRVGFTDLVHAMMSVMVFMAIALSDHRVTECLFPGHVKEMDEVMESFPLMVGVICSSLFLVFPTSRHGIGCMSN